MRFVNLFIILFASSIMLSQKNIEIVKEIKENIAIGELKKATELSENMVHYPYPRRGIIKDVEESKQIIHRIYSEFSITEMQLVPLFKKHNLPHHQEQIAEWEANKWLEYRMIDGQKRYFNRAVSNLALRLQQQSDEQRKTTLENDSFEQFKADYVKNLIKTQKAGEPTAPQWFKINYSITVKANAVPEGELVSCWMPYPRKDAALQKEVELLAHAPIKRRTAPAKSTHQAILLQKKAVADEPTVFSCEFKFCSFAQYFDLDKLQISAYDTSTELYKTYTVQQLPHIHFDEQIQQITDQVVGNETHPREIVKRIHAYICDNIIWSGAQEYSIMNNIPNYVLDNKKGDCGMQTFLFMSMARYKGIPVRWLSGWMLHPGKVNLHDWCEVYYQNVGWVPLDMSFQRLPADDKRVENFYLSGIDAYRLLVNNGVAGQLVSTKQHFRSEPYDFQRGEVEWSGGNLYFDQWTYKIDVEYLQP